MYIPSAIFSAAVAYALLLHTGPVFGEGAKATAEGHGTVANEAGDAQLVSAPQKSMPTNVTVGTLASAEENIAAPLPSAAERIARLKASFEADEKRLEQMNASLNAPESEYAKAETNFRSLDSERTALQQKLSDSKNIDKHDELAPLQIGAAALEKKWTLAKERFDLAIGERKAVQESVATLQLKLESDRATLLKLQDATEPQPLTAPPAGPLQPTQPVPQADGAPALLSSQTPPGGTTPDSPLSLTPAPAANTPSPPVVDPHQLSASAPAPTLRRADLDRKDGQGAGGRKCSGAKEPGRGQDCRRRRTLNYRPD